MNHRPLAHWLTFAGAIPFVLGAVLLVLGINNLPVLGSVETVVKTYGLVIVSFMAGCQWGIHLPRNDKWAVILPVVSNAVTLIVWFVFMLASVRVSLMVMACSFMALLLVDARLKLENRITKDYYRVRVWVSIIVLVSLCVATIFASA